jgi:hypothetical protein
MSDRLTLTRAFEGAGLKSDDAERIATEDLRRDLRQDHRSPLKKRSPCT